MDGVVAVNILICWCFPANLNESLLSMFSLFVIMDKRRAMLRNNLKGLRNSSRILPLSRNGLTEGVKEELRQNQFFP